MKDQEYFERIENYLSGSMSPEELEKFESEISANPELANDVNSQKELQLAVELGALKEDLHTIHNELKSNGQRTSFNWLAIAAGIAVLFTIGVYFLQDDDPAEELFATYSTVDPGLPVPMSSTTHYLFYDAMVDYKSEKYEVAIEKWKGIERAEPKNDTLNFYLGAAHFNLGDYEKALTYFTKVNTENQGTIANKAQWYTVLALLKTGNKEAVLSLTPGDTSRYRSDILQIQKELEK